MPKIGTDTHTVDNTATASTAVAIDDDHDGLVVDDSVVPAAVDVDNSAAAVDNTAMASTAVAIDDDLDGLVTDAVDEPVNPAIIGGDVPVGSAVNVPDSEPVGSAVYDVGWSVTNSHNFDDNVDIVVKQQLTWLPPRLPPDTGQVAGHMAGATIAVNDASVVYAAVDVDNSAAVVDNTATAGVAVVYYDAEVVTVTANSDDVDDSAVAVDNTATAGVAVSVSDDDVHIAAIAAVVKAAANSSVEVVAVDAAADSIAVITKVVAVADNIEVGSVDNRCQEGFQLLKMDGGIGAALRAVSRGEKIIKYLSCAIKLVPCKDGRRHLVFDTGWSC